MKNFSDYLKTFSPTILRIGMSVVVIWFGFQELTNPDMWTSYIPDSVVSMSGLNALALVYINGMFEFIFGICLLLGIQTRISALLLALHMFDITYVVGYDAIGIRDLGLSFALFSIFMFGESPLSIDIFKKTEEENIPLNMNGIQ